MPMILLSPVIWRKIPSRGCARRCWTPLRSLTLPPPPPNAVFSYPPPSFTALLHCRYLFIAIILVQYHVFFYYSCALALVFLYCKYYCWVDLSVRKRCESFFGSLHPPIIKFWPLLRHNIIYCNHPVRSTVTYFGIIMRLWSFSWGRFYTATSVLQ